MKPGRVVYIRLTPKDCMSCVDVTAQAGYNPNPMSFGQIVSSAIGVMLESLRQTKIIPDREGFEYASMMARWASDVKADRGIKLGITRALEFSERPTLKTITIDPVLARKKIEFEELAFKANHDEQNMSEADKVRLQELLAELRPL